eukprot:g5679.t1
MNDSDSDYDDPFAFDDTPTNYTPPRTRSQRGRRRPASNVRRRPTSNVRPVTIDLVDEEKEDEMEIGSDEEKKEEEDDDIIALDEFEDADGPIWQWMDNNNTWKNFSSSDIRILEEVLADRKRFKELKIGYSKYVVDLQEGTQFNVMSRRTRPVRRIPPYDRTGLRTEPPAGYGRNGYRRRGSPRSDQICPYFLRGYCRDGPRCLMSHSRTGTPPIGRFNPPPIRMPTPSNRLTCPYFANGYCRNGRRCPMLHDRNNRNTTTTTTTTTNTNTPCPYFARGYCRNGNNCPQRHVRGHLGRGDEMDIDNMTYDQILELEERMGNVPTKLTKPLTKSQISRLPTRKFQGNSDSLKDHTSCCVCLCDYEKGDDLITLPCLHTFHKDCITQWLGKQKPTCPVCKAFVDTENDSEKQRKACTPCLDFARGSCRRSNCPYLHGKAGGRHVIDDDDDDDVVIVSAPSQVSTKEEEEDDVIVLPSVPSKDNGGDSPPPPGVLTLNMFEDDEPPGVLDLSLLTSG